MIFVASRCRDMQGVKTSYYIDLDICWWFIWLDEIIWLCSNVRSILVYGAKNRFFLSNNTFFVEHYNPMKPELYVFPLLGRYREGQPIRQVLIRTEH